MFLSTDNYLAQFRRLIESGTSVSLAVAFWGRGAEKLIEAVWAGISLRILFNLGNGGTNPQVIRDLLDLGLPGLELLIDDDLHAKVAISETAAIVGSANVSVNGLGLEGSECAGWKEAGVQIDDSAQVAEVQGWFDALWARGEAVTDERLTAAQIQWDNNRSSRPKLSKGFYQALKAGELDGRGIYVEVHRLDASVEAEEAAAEAISDAQRDGMLGARNTQVDWYEDWPEDYDEPLPADKAIISVYYSPNKGVSVSGACERIPFMDRSFKNADGHTSSLVMVRKLKEVEGFAFSRSDAAKLTKIIRPWVKSLYAEEDSDIARCLPLDVFFDWDKKKKEKS